MKISERQLRRLISEEVRAYKRGTISELGFLKKFFGRGGAEATAEEPAAAATAEKPAAAATAEKPAAAATAEKPAAAATAEKPAASAPKVWPIEVNFPSSENLEQFVGLESIENNGTIIDLAIKRNLITRQNTLQLSDKRTDEKALKMYNEALKGLTDEIEGLINKRLKSGDEFSFIEMLKKPLLHSSKIDPNTKKPKVVRTATPPAEIQALLNKVFPEGNSLGQKIYAYCIIFLLDSVANNRDAIEKKLENQLTQAKAEYNRKLNSYRESCKRSLGAGTYLSRIFGSDKVLGNPYEVKEMLFSHLDSLDYEAIESGMEMVISTVLESAATKNDQLIFERWQQMAGLLRG